MITRVRRADVVFTMPTATVSAVEPNRDIITVPLTAVGTDESAAVRQQSTVSAALARQRQIKASLSADQMEPVALVCRRSGERWRAGTAGKALAFPPRAMRRRDAENRLKPVEGTGALGNFRPAILKRTARSTVPAGGYIHDPLGAALNQRSDLAAGFPGGRGEGG